MAFWELKLHPKIFKALLGSPHIKQSCVAHLTSNNSVNFHGGSTIAEPAFPTNQQRAFACFFRPELHYQVWCYGKLCTDNCWIFQYSMYLVLSCEPSKKKASFSKAPICYVQQGEKQSEFTYKMVAWYVVVRRADRTATSGHEGSNTVRPRPNQEVHAHY